MNFVIWFLIAILFAGTADAAPIGAAIAAFASTAIGGAIVKAVIGLALSIGASLLKSMFVKKPEQKDPGTTLNLKVGGDNPLFFPLGTSATGGMRVYAGAWTAGKTPNEYAVDVIAVSALPLPGVVLPTEVWFNDQKVTVLTGEVKQLAGWPVLEYRKNGADYAWIDFHNGTQTTPDVYLLSNFGSHPDYPWKSDMIGRGVAYVTLTARYEKNGLWAGGLPALTIVTPSIPLYDVRKDSSVGGSGSHRWNNPLTWEPSDNAMVRAYNVARGIYYDSEWVYGGQNWPAFRLPVASWMAGQNACDVLIGGVRQFHGGGVVECDVEPARSIEELLRSSSALIAEVGGIYKIRVGAPGAPVYSFTDANIAVTREQGYSPFPGMEDTYNIVRLSYTEPAQKWSSKESPERRDDDLIESDDNRELPTSIELPWVTDNNTVQRIGKAALLNGRRFRRHQHYLPPEAWLLEPLDVVSWTSQYNGYENKLFDLEQISGESSLMQGVTIRENDPSDYDWNPATDPLDYETIPLVPNYPAAQPMTGWQVFPAIIKDNDGDNRRPSIGVGYAAELTDVDRVHVQVRLAGETNLVFDGEIPYDRVSIAPSTILQGQFLPVTDYEARGILVPYSDRVTEWSGWLGVTTDNVLLGEKDIYLPGIIDGIQDTVSDATLWIRDGVRQTILEQQRIAQLTADQDFGNYTARQTMRREAAITTANIGASYTEAITVAVGPDSAIALRIEDLEVYVNDTVASAIDSLETQITDQGEALASAITALSAASADGNTATANFRMGVSAGPAGYSSRIAMEARTGGAGTWRSAGLFIDVPASPGDPSRVLILADQFVVADSSGTVQNPLVFQSGALTLNVANIGTVNAGVIQNTTNKLVMNIAAGTLEFYD